MTTMSPELSQRLSAAVDAMPAFPKSVQRILDISRDVNSTPRELVDVIDKDPVMTVKVLKVVNSAYFGLPRQITSIGHAVVYLGFNPIKNLALSIAAVGTMPGKNIAGLDIQQFLLHSLTTAGLARQLALHSRQADPMECFIAGLLHDFGKVVLAQSMPAQFQAALQDCQRSGCSLGQALQLHTGVDHGVVGVMLLQKWRFSSELIETIGHQTPTQYHDSGMNACVFAANQISKKLQFGHGGNPAYDELPAAAQQRLGGTLEEVVAHLGDLTPVLDEARLFANL